SYTLPVDATITLETTRDIDPQAFDYYDIRMVYSGVDTADASAIDCDTTNDGTNGTLTFNEAEVNNVITPSFIHKASRCAEPNFTKAVVSGPTETVTPGQYQISYEIRVANSDDDPVSYDISDLPAFGAGVAIESASYVFDEGADGVDLTAPVVLSAGSPALGIAWTIANNEVLEAGASNLYRLDLIFSVTESELTSASANCDLDTAGGETGTGLWNNATFVNALTGDEITTFDCAPVAGRFLIEETARQVTEYGGSQGHYIVYDIKVTSTYSETKNYRLQDVISVGAGFDNIHTKVAAYSASAGTPAAASTLTDTSYNEGRIDFLIAEDQPIAPGETITHSIAVNLSFTDPHGAYSSGLEAVTAESADCDTTNDGTTAPVVATATYNSATVTLMEGGAEVADESATASGCAPHPIFKEVISGPDEIPGRPNAYRITYGVHVRNGSVTDDSYTLTDSPLFGPGVTITQLSWSLDSDGDGAFEAVNNVIAGSGPYEIAAAGTALPAGAYHYYELALEFDLVPSELTAEGSDCTLDTGETASGLLNRIVLDTGLDGAAESSTGGLVDHACEPMPGGSQIVLTKVAQDGWTATATPNQFAKDYIIEVQNPGTLQRSYDLTEIPRMEAEAVTIDKIEVARDQDHDTDDNDYGTAVEVYPTGFTGDLADGVILEEDTVLLGSQVDRFKVTITFTLDPEKATAKGGNAVLEPGEAGTGLSNEVRTLSDSEELIAQALVANPGVIRLTKVRHAGPIFDAATGNWEVVYRIGAENLSETATEYDLSDVLSLGEGLSLEPADRVFVTKLEAGNATSSPTIRVPEAGLTVAGDGTLVLESGRSLAGEALDYYDLRMVYSGADTADATALDCDRTNDGANGTLTFNKATATVALADAPAFTASAERCASSRVTKSVLSGPVLTSTPGEFEVVYSIRVSNSDDEEVSYDLFDKPRFGAGVNILEASYRLDAGATGSYGSTQELDPAEVEEEARWTLANNRPLITGAADLFEITVRYSIDDTVLTSLTADCNPDLGEEGWTGLKNEAIYTDDDSLTEEVVNDCAEARGKLLVSKFVTEVAKDPNGWATAVFQYEVLNTDPSPLNYALTDFMQISEAVNLRGTGSYSYELNGDALASGTREITPTFAEIGEPSWTLAEDQTISSGNTHVYSVEFGFEYKEDEISSASADCNPDNDGGAGTGFLNRAVVDTTTAGRTDEQEEDYGCAAVPVYKELIYGPIEDPANPGDFTVRYEIRVHNALTEAQNYVLTDSPLFGEGASITQASYSYDQGDDADYELLDQSLDITQTSWQLGDAELAAETADSYIIQIEYSVDDTQVTDETSDCELTGGETGTGLLNRASATIHGEDFTYEDCANMPLPSDLKLTKTFDPSTIEAGIGGGANDLKLTYNLSILNPGTLPQTFTLTDIPRLDPLSVTLHSAELVGTGEVYDASSYSGDLYVDGIVLLTDFEIAAGEQLDFVLEMEVSIDPTEVTSDGSDAELKSFEEGTGLSNEMRTLTQRDRESSTQVLTPLPSTVRVDKRRLSGPDYDLASGIWTASYEIEVSNTSSSAVEYELVDRIHKGAGVNLIVGNEAVLSAEISGGGSLFVDQTLTSTEVQPGLLELDLQSGATLNAGTSHIYSLRLNYTLDNTAPVTDPAYDCILTNDGTVAPDDIATLTFNRVTVKRSQSPQLEHSDIACAEPRVVKRLVSGPSPLAGENNLFELVYEVRAANSDEEEVSYDLFDKPYFGAGVVIESASYTADYGFDSSPELVDQPLDPEVLTTSDSSGAWALANNRSLAAHSRDNYTIKVYFSLDNTTLTTQSGDCTIESAEEGFTGLRNQVTYQDDVNPAKSFEVCQEVPTDIVVSKRLLPETLDIRIESEDAVMMFYELQVTSLHPSETLVYQLSDVATTGFRDITGFELVSVDLGGDTENLEVSVDSFENRSAGEPWVLASSQSISPGNSHVYRTAMLVSTPLSLTLPDQEASIYGGSVTRQDFASWDCQAGNDGGNPTGAVNSLEGSIVDASRETKVYGQSSCFTLPVIKKHLETRFLEPVSDEVTGLNRYEVVWGVLVSNNFDEPRLYYLDDELRDLPQGVSYESHRFNVDFGFDGGFDSLDIEPTVETNLGGDYFQMAEERILAANSHDYYEVTSVIVVDTALANGADMDCDGTAESGLWNGAYFENGPTTSTSSIFFSELTFDDCTEIPLGVQVSKTYGDLDAPVEISSDPRVYEFSYSISVKNPTNHNQEFTLIDTPAFGKDVTMISAVTAAGTNLDVNASQWDLDDEIIVPGDELNYSITVQVQVADDVDSESADCLLEGFESGTGLLNKVTTTSENYDSGLSSGQSAASYCFPVPVYGYDFGDGPSDYKNMIEEDGPRHVADDRVYFGEFPSAELDATEQLIVEADQDTEQVFVLPEGETGVYEVTLPVVNESGYTAYSYMWIDFNNNGVFEVNEVTKAEVPDGATTVTFPVQLPTSGVSRDDARSITAQEALSADTASLGGSASSSAPSQAPSQSQPFAVQLAQLGATSSLSGVQTGQAVPSLFAPFFVMRARISLSDLDELLGPVPGGGEDPRSTGMGLNGEVEDHRMVVTPAITTEKVLESFDLESLDLAAQTARVLFNYKLTVSNVSALDWGYTLLEEPSSSATIGAGSQFTFTPLTAGLTFPDGSDERVVGITQSGGAGGPLSSSYVVGPIASEVQDIAGNSQHEYSAVAAINFTDINVTSEEDFIQGLIDSCTTGENQFMGTSLDGAGVFYNQATSQQVDVIASSATSDGGFSSDACPTADDYSGFLIRMDKSLFEQVPDGVALAGEELLWV
ncbi:GEVED domain-containing protein, partial [Breoghania sp.]|uniref:GEVED domain-containing protein n=1 Tax=Breoghania sp. TaxID=2065378 RepID=UPI002629E525